MAPQNVKRRKLDHDSSQSDNSESEMLVVDETTDVEEAEEEEEEEETSTHEDGMKSGTAVQNGNSKAARSTDPAILAGGAYKSIFEQQIDAMLEQVKLDYKVPMESAIKALFALRTSIKNIKPRKKLEISEAVVALRKSKVVIPFQEPNRDSSATYKLEFSPPSDVDINVIGSYATQTMTKSNTLCVDMLVTMPDMVLQANDYKKYRYFHKRAYYLACIAAELQGKNFDIRYDLLNGNHLQPVLVVKPVKGSAYDFSASKCHIRIIVGCSARIFADTKLPPTKNAIQPDSLQEKGATPFYNATIKADGAYTPYLKLLDHTSKQVQGFRDSCILGRIWLKQRGLGGSLARGGFGPFEWAALTALLLQGGGSKDQPVLSPGYNSYQLFKAVVQYLGSKDLAAKPVIFQTSGLELAKSAYPVFYDGPRGVNLLYKMTSSSYSTLVEEAKSSLQMLNETSFDQFESTFIIRKDHPLYQYDNVISIEKPTSSFDLGAQDYTTPERELSVKVAELLKVGLTDRVKAIHVTGTDVPSWELNQKTPVSTQRQISLSVGFSYDPEHVDRLVDHGPSAEEKTKAARFQRFWGEKAELRRFRDGSILESVVWQASDGPAFSQIVKYVIKKHIGTEVHFTGEDVTQLLPESAGTVAFDGIKEAFRVFDNDVRALERLPLQLKQISATGAQLRLTSLRPATFSPIQHLREPADVVIQFEGSGRWPDDIIAIQRTKVAFLIKIGELLEDSVDGVETKLGMENVSRQFQNCGYLDVFYPTGAVFRLRIQNDREETLLNRLIKDKSTENYIREEALLASSLYKQSYQQLPLLTQSIATHCTRFPLLSPTIRLLKRWFASHMLSTHIPAPIIELFAIRTFLQPYPWRTPSSASTAFLRTLQYLARWDWHNVPLAIDFSGTMSSQDITAIDTRLKAWRKLDPAMNRIALVIATNHDNTGTVFTDGKPTKVIAARMTALAKSAVARIKDTSLLTEHNTSPIKSLFKTPQDHFDFLIHIAPKFTGSNRGTARSSKNNEVVQFKNLVVQKETSEEKHLVGYEPVKLFLQELEECYGDNVLFFWDEISNLVIGGLWNPTKSAERSFRVNLGFACVPASCGEGNDAKVVIDKKGILGEIVRLGDDLISGFEVRK